MHRRHLIAITVTSLAAFLIAAPAHSAVSVGQKAPEFTAKDATGKTVNLADFKGKTVVLEWVNPGCPYVKKHYGAGNMQSTQKDARGTGVVWLAINSTDTAHPDYLAPAALQSWMTQQKAAAAHTLMDESGSIGQQYAARTTPHMYIISPQGNVVYAGGIDSIASANPGPTLKLPPTTLNKAWARWLQANLSAARTPSRTAARSSTKVKKILLGMNLTAK